MKNSVPNNSHAGDQGYRGVQGGDGQCGLGHRRVFRHVRTVGHDCAHAQAESEEGMAQGGQEALPGEFAEVEAEHEVPGRGEVSQCPAEAEQHQQQHEQQGHEDFHHGADAAGHAHRHHAAGQQDEQGVPDELPAAVAL
jgi:hypothetical protein